MPDDNYNELKDVSKRLENMQSTQMVQQNKELINRLNTKFETRYIIPEAVFRQYFLNTFIRYIANKGTLQGTEEQIQFDDYNLRKWLEVANGPYNEVDVIGPDNQVVLTIPSLYLNSTNAIDKLEDFNFNTVAKSYLAKSAVLPELGANDMADKLSGLPRFIDTAGVSKQKQMWMDVVTYYKKLIEPQEKAKQPHPQVANKVKMDKEDLGLDL